MGYYIQARRPAKGSEPAFRMHLFLWGPLWAFACREAPDILDEEDAAFGFTSDGHYVSVAKARGPRSSPRFRKAWVREFRDFCAGSGGFWIR